MTSDLAGFVTILAGDRGEALARQLDQFPEMTYVPLVKPAAFVAAELVARYRRLAAQDPSSAPAARELLSLVVRDPRSSTLGISGCRSKPGYESLAGPVTLDFSHVGRTAP